MNFKYLFFVIAIAKKFVLFMSTKIKFELYKY